MKPETALSALLAPFAVIDKTRRRFLGTLAAVGGAVWVAACAPSGGGYYSSPDGAANPDSATPDLAGGHSPDLLSEGAPDLALAEGPSAVACGPYEAHHPFGVPPYLDCTFPYGYRVGGPYGQCYCYAPYYADRRGLRDRENRASRRDFLALFERLTNRPRQRLS